MQGSNRCKQSLAAGWEHFHNGRVESIEFIREGKAGWSCWYCQKFKIHWVHGMRILPGRLSGGNSNSKILRPLQWCEAVWNNLFFKPEFYLQVLFSKKWCGKSFLLHRVWILRWKLPSALGYSKIYGWCQRNVWIIKNIFIILFFYLLIFN